MAARRGPTRLAGQTRRPTSCRGRRAARARRSPAGLHHDGDDRPGRARPVRLPAAADRPVPETSTSRSSPCRRSIPARARRRWSARSRGGWRRRSTRCRASTRSRSMSLEGVSQVIVQFELGRDVDQAAQDMRDKVDAIRREPAGETSSRRSSRSSTRPTSRSSRWRCRPTDADRRLTQLADEAVRRRIEAVPGVGNVQVIGRPAAPGARVSCCPTGCRRRASVSTT